jgi:CRP/FNR family transcriptional regulator
VLGRQLAQALGERLAVARRPMLRVAAGTTLLHAGDPVTRLAFLATGRINAIMHQRGADGGHVIPVTFAAGEVVLLSQLFGDRPSLVDLVAASEVSLQWVPIAELERALLADQALLVVLVRFLAQRLREAQLREQGWVERGVQERVRATLVRLAEHAPRETGGGWRIEATHEELASRSGVSRPKLSQALKRLEKAGHLRLRRGAIEIIHLDGLQSGA